MSRTYFCKHRDGFSLIEALISVVIVSFAVVALMALLGSGTQVTAYGNNVCTAVVLAEQARANADAVAFADLPALNGQQLQILDASDVPLAELSRYRQVLTVAAVDPVTMAAYAGPDPQMYQITVAVTCDGDELTRVSWLRGQ